MSGVVVGSKLVSGGNVTLRRVSKAAVNRFTRWLMLVSGVVFVGVGFGLYAWFGSYTTGLHTVSTVDGFRLVFDRSLSTWLMIGGLGGFGVGLMNLLAAGVGFVFKRLNIFNVQGFLMLPAILVAFAVLTPAMLHENAVATRLEDAAGVRLGVVNIARYDTLGDDKYGKPVTSKVFTVKNMAGDDVRLRVQNLDTNTGYVVVFTLVK